MESTHLPGELGLFSFASTFVAVGRGGLRAVLSCYLLPWSSDRRLWVDEHATQEVLLSRLEQSFQETGGTPRILLVRPVRPLGSLGVEDDAVWSGIFKRFCGHFGCRPEPLGSTWASTVGLDPIAEAAQQQCFSTLEALQLWLERMAVATGSERGALGTLPAAAFVSDKAAFHAVASDGFVLFAGDAYSVPAAYISKTVWLSRRGRHVVVRSQQGDTLAVHEAGKGQGGVVMQRQHFEAVRRRADRDLHSLRRQFLASFPADERFLTHLIAQRRQGAAASLRAVLGLASRHRPDAMRAVFGQCLHLNNFSHRFIQGLLAAPAVSTSRVAETAEQGVLF